MRKSVSFRVYDYDSLDFGLSHELLNLSGSLVSGLLMNGLLPRAR